MGIYLTDFFYRCHYPAQNPSRCKSILVMRIYNIGIISNTYSFIDDSYLATASWSTQLECFFGEDASVWVGTNNGLLRLNPATRALLDQVTGLPSR